MKIYKVLCYGMLALLSSFQDAAAQKNNDGEKSASSEYRNAIGIRAGRTSGLTYKHFFGPSAAFEGIVGFWPNAIGFTGLYEKHLATGLSGLKFYYGGGGHFTGETGRYYYHRYNDPQGDYKYRYGRNGWGLGIDGIVGLDYKIGVIPLALSFDLKPFIEVSNYGNIYTALDAGFGVKLAF